MRLREIFPTTYFPTTAISVVYVSLELEKIGSEVRHRRMGGWGGRSPCAFCGIRLLVGFVLLQNCTFRIARAVSTPSITAATTMDMKERDGIS